jgi:methionyl-tRNA formyltransferase
MDTGPIYSTTNLTIQKDWRSQELLQALAELGPQAVDKALSAIQSGVSPQPQQGVTSLAPKITKEEARIDWLLSSLTLSRKIRAFYPAPCAWSTWEENSFKITRAHAGTADLSVGEIAVIDGDVVVGCGEGTALILEAVVPAGKKEMAAIEWARGARLMQGAHFG